jgi:hypothetical protein
MVMAAFALFQVGTACRALSRVPEAGALPPPLWDGVAALAWSGMACVMLRLLWRGTGLRLLLRFLIGFSIYSVFRLFIFSQADYDRGRLSFLTMWLVGCVAAALVWNRYANRISNGVSSHDREPQD